VAAFVGFPVALVLAWVFELTPLGVKRTQRLEGQGPATASGLSLPYFALLLVTVASAGGVGWWAVRDSVSQGSAVAPESDGLLLPAGLDNEATPPVRSLAVLPLDDFSEGEGGAYFTAGMHEELVSQLSQLGTVRVLSRTSVVQFDRTGKTMPEIADELGVEGVVEGSVFRADDRVRITVQLIYGPQDRHLWANSYDGTLEDAIALQREVAQAIAKEIKAELGTEDAFEPTPRVVANSRAQDAYLKGRFEQAKATPDALESAIAHYQEAVRADSTFAPAFAGLAASRFLLSLSPGDSGPAMSPEEMGVAAPLERAFLLDRESPEATAVMLTLQSALGSIGEISLPEGVVIGVDSTISIDSELSVSATEFGRQLQRIVVEKSPRVSHRGGLTGRLSSARRLQVAGDYARAEEALRELVAAAPEVHEAWDALEYLMAQKGDFEGALEVRKQRPGASAEVPEEAVALVEVEARMKEEGSRAYWSWKLAELNERTANGDKVSPVEKARACVGLGDFETAIAYLHEGLEGKDRTILSLWSDPAWDPLRTDPRFREILTRLRRVGARPGVFDPSWP
jgi:TolB-like protein